jgi:hypothetical protein
MATEHNIITDGNVAVLEPHFKRLRGDLPRLPGQWIRQRLMDLCVRAGRGADQDGRGQRTGYMGGNFYLYPGAEFVSVLFVLVLLRERV